MAELSELNDEQLVEHARESGEGDYRAFNELVLRHQGRILANCRYLTRSSGDSEDLAQEVFLKAFFALKRFEGRSRFSTWLQRIKINHCVTFLRKTRGKISESLDGDEGEERDKVLMDPRAEREFSRIDSQRRIRQILDVLPDSLRLPLILRDMDGLSYQEIADQLELGLSAVKMRIKRGREEFIKLYNGGDRRSEMEMSRHE